MSTIKQIREHLADTAKYHGMSYAAIVGVAAEIEGVEDRDERTKLRREFRQAHALTSQVWARVDKRFSVYGDEPAQAIRAMAYCCQLPLDDCMDMWESHRAHIDEPGALGLVLADVNAELDARRNSDKSRQPSLAAQCADLVQQWSENYIMASPIAQDMRDELTMLPSIAAEIKRRAKGAK